VIEKDVKKPLALSGSELPDFLVQALVACIRDRVDGLGE